MLQHQLPWLFGVKSVCQGLMVDQSNITRPYHCPNPLACPGGLLSANESTPMCAIGGVKIITKQVLLSKKDQGRTSQQVLVEFRIQHLQELLSQLQLFKSIFGHFERPECP